MRTPELFGNAFSTIGDLVDSTVTGLDAEALAYRPDAGANPIGWLVWHLTRVQDDHVAGVAQVQQVYTSCGFAPRFALPFDAGDIGYGHTPEQVGAVRVEEPALLLEYHQTVCGATLAYVGTLDDDDLDRVVDHRYDPPVTAGVRLHSVVADCLQHLGQAAYVRWLWERR